MDSPEVRQLSLTLFADIKPICVRISELALQPEEDFQRHTTELIHNLRELTHRTKWHRQEHHNSEYLLSTKLADYMFFPLSNLLKHSNLHEQVIQYVLDIISFLLQWSWRNNLDEKLLDQLCPLVIFLGGGPSILVTRTSQISDKDFDFKVSAVGCLVQLIKCFPRLYLTEEDNSQKRLSILGDATTLLLDVMCSFNSPLNQEENEVVLDVLDIISWLYSTRVTAEQTSYVFPGMVSKIVNYSISTRNLHAGTITKVIKTLQDLIIKVFDDKGLDISISDASVTSENLQSLQDLMAEDQPGNQRIIPIQIEMTETNHEHRTELWLRATSKQLKLSLLSLFKYLFFNSTMRTKVAVNISLSDAIFEFVNAVTKRCFQSLFTEVVQSGFDIISALIFVITSHSPQVLEQDLLRRSGRVYLQFEYSKLELLTKQLVLKTNNLVFNQFLSVLTLLNEEKIAVCVAAIKVHLFTLQSLSDITKTGSEALALIKKKILLTLVYQMALKDYSGKSKQRAGKDELLRLLNADLTRTNTLDNIELPLHINASALAKLKKEDKSMNAPQDSSDLRRLVTSWTDEFQDKSVVLFKNVLSKSTEECLKGLLFFIGLQGQSEMETLISTVYETEPISESEDDGMLSKAVALWTCNQLFRSATRDSSSSLSLGFAEFLDIDEEESQEDLDESSYLILDQALEMISQVKDRIAEGALTTKQTNIYQMAYVTALESIEVLSVQLSKEDFQSDVLMNYLFLVLEALTYPPESEVHLQARKTLNSVVQTFYGGSLGDLITDNADYLIDSLSMSLSSASGLIPSLPGILLVILKISGAQLLQTNQLNDILSEIFLVIDSYHGYSVLVENFFLVFETIVEITREIYGKVLSDETNITHEYITSRYKPWGMTTRHQMLSLIDDNERIVEEFENFDQTKEYFKRKPDVPFGEQGDSDDEDPEDENESTRPSEENNWDCPIPKSVYLLIQQIFTYGLQFLSHPSDKLKIQVFRTLQKAYPIMSSNYSILMPLLAQYWPMILVLTSGVSTTSDYDFTLTLQHTIEPSLRLTMQIIHEDAKHELFMSKRFLDMWDFWKKKSFKFKQSKSQKDKGLTVSTTTVPPSTSQLYALVLIAGLNTYEKIIPDLTAIEIAEACIKLAIPKGTYLSRDTRALFWVLKNHGK